MAPEKEIHLRDWFAGQALNGLLMNPGTPRPETALEEHASSLAEQAFAYADAMVKERSKPHKVSSLSDLPEGSTVLPPEARVQKPEGLPVRHDVPATPLQEQLETDREKTRGRARKGK